MNILRQRAWGRLLNIDDVIRISIKDGIMNDV